MSEANQETLQTYNQGVERYIDGTVKVTSGWQQAWLDSVFSDIALGAPILEIGSAFGRDARYLMSKGYKPSLTDASTSFVEYLREGGLDADVLDIVNDRPSGMYDVILACAVFLHFTDEDFQKAVGNVRAALNDNGKFAFSVKRGEGEEWTEEKMDAPRYFNYYEPERLRKKLGEAGMRVIDIQPDEKWLHVVSTKEA